MFLALPCFAALGLALPLCMVRSTTPGSRSDKAQLAAFAIAASLLVNYALGMIFPDLRWVMAWGGLIAIASLVALAATLARRRWSVSDLFGMGWGRGLLAVAALLLFSGVILFEPLQAWDARSIWFFQGKRIYFNGGFDATQGWANPAYLFSHIDYPKLLPLLAAEFAFTFGVWNEYIPKAALLALLTPVVLGLLGAGRKINFSLFFLGGVLLLGGKDLLWNGYMDAFPAMYGSLALLFLSRWLQARSLLDLTTGITFLGVVLNLKNEGALLAVCVGLVLVAVWLFRARKLEDRAVSAMPRCAWIAVLLPLAGFAAWSLAKWHLQVPNDLQLGPDSLRRAWQRLGDGELAPIWDALWIKGRAVLAAGILLLAAALAKILGTRLTPVMWFPAGVAVLYLVGMSVIYLSTPHELLWHLKFSADRTALVGVAGLFASCFMVLEAMESPPANVERRDFKHSGM